MGIFDLFRRKPAASDQPEPSFDALRDLVLDKLAPGDIVDFDLRSYEVRDRAHVDTGTPPPGDEWDLRAADDRLRLLREPVRGGDAVWTVLRNVSLGEIDGDVRHEILTRDDPPSQLFFHSAPYLMERSGAGYVRRAGGTGPEEGFVAWSYTRADDATRVLRLEQVSETDVVAAAGERVEEYHFTNLLPGASRHR